MSRLGSLQDFAAAGVDAIVECAACGRLVRADPDSLYQLLKIKWPRTLAIQARKLRCGRCGHRGARIAPSPRIVGPLDCDEFEADLKAMWERVMAEELTGQCNAEIAGPDGDGLVYLVSRKDPAMTLACLGTEQEAAELVSQWLGARDFQENT